MRKIKLVSKLLFAAAGCMMAAGCTCVSFSPAGSKDDSISLTDAKQYQIVNAETIVLNTVSEEENLPVPELNLLSMTLRNSPGNAFIQNWTSQAELIRQNGEQGTLTNDTDALRVATRIIAPNVFDNSPAAIPVQIKSVIMIRPGKISPWWLTGYLLSLSTSPMCERSLGTVIVAAVDGSGNTIGAKVILLRRSYWISGLLPTAAMCGGKYSVSKGDAGNMDDEEKSLLNQIMARAAVDILNINSGKTPATSPEWINIRTAAIESIVAGDETSVIKLLKDCRRQSIGGKECQDWLNLID
jgi:hypothetical protein